MANKIELEKYVNFDINNIIELYRSCQIIIARRGISSFKCNKITNNPLTIYSIVHSKIINSKTQNCVSSNEKIKTDKVKIIITLDLFEKENYSNEFIDFKNFKIINHRRKKRRLSSNLYFVSRLFCNKRKPSRRYLKFTKFNKDKNVIRNLYPLLNIWVRGIKDDSTDGGILHCKIEPNLVSFNGFLDEKLLDYVDNPKLFVNKILKNNLRKNDYGRTIKRAIKITSKI